MSGHDTSDSGREQQEHAAGAGQDSPARPVPGPPKSRRPGPGKAGRDDGADGEQGDGMRAQQVREDNENEDQDAQWQK
jgi:hypothetical protein